MSLPERSSSAKLNPPEVPAPGIAGGGNANATPVRQSGKLFRQAHLDCVVLLFGLGALAPRLECDKEEGAVGALDKRHKVEPDYARRVLDARCLAEELLDFVSRPHRSVRAKRHRAIVTPCKCSPGPLPARSRLAASTRTIRRPLPTPPATRSSSRPFELRSATSSHTHSLRCRRSC